MKRRSLLKRFGAGGLLTLTGMQTASATPVTEVSDGIIRFNDSRADMRVSDYDPETADFDIQRCCYYCDGDPRFDCPYECDCCICDAQ